jgi:hypothetical protein
VVDSAVGQQQVSISGHGYDVCGFPLPLEGLLEFLQGFPDIVLGYDAVTLIDASGLVTQDHHAHDLTYAFLIEIPHH